MSKTFFQSRIKKCRDCTECWLAAAPGKQQWQAARLSSLLMGRNGLHQHHLLAGLSSRYFTTWYSVWRVAGLQIRNPDDVEVWTNAEVIFFNVTLTFDIPILTKYERKLSKNYSLIRNFSKFVTFGEMFFSFFSFGLPWVYVRRNVLQKIFEKGWN